MTIIDLNCDVGEIPGSAAGRRQEELLRLVSSANVACGGHAGNPEMMRATILQAQAAGAAIGAHPGYEDAANFGRIELQISHEAIADSVHRQILALAVIADSLGARIAHVKPHGALYNQAARDEAIARAIAAGVARWSRGREEILVGRAGSVMLSEFRAAGFPVAAEAFADRRYEQDGSLRARRFDDAMLDAPEEAAQQAVRIVRDGCAISVEGHNVPLQADTLCIHGDSAGALEIAKAVAAAFDQLRIARRSLVRTELR